MSASTHPANQQSKPRVYEQEKRLSESMLWAFLEYYYSHCGPSAWNHIPFYPTSNPYIGEAYAEIILGSLLDILPVLDLKEPVYVVEMATGTGTFSYYLLKELVAKMAQFDVLKDVKICYVMTDFTENNVDYWKQNPYLVPFIEAGQLDFGVYRPEDDDGVTLHLSGTRLEKGAVVNPMFSLANYFFDSIRQDLFRVKDGKLSETRLTHTSALDVELFQDIEAQAELLQQLDKHETHHAMSFPYYETEAMDAVLKEYQAKLPEGSILFPLGAIRCAKRLLEISDNNLILISSDKGFTDINYMEGHFSHNLTPHHGAFSYMVNYDALGRYFHAQGGQSFLTEEHYPILVSGVFSLLKKAPGLPLNHARYFFEQKLVKQNKLNDLYYCQSYIFLGEQKEPKELFNSYMAMLRLSLNDPIYYCGLADKIFETLSHLDSTQQAYLMDALKAIEANMYQVRFEHNALFWIGKTYYGLNMLEEAQRIFTRSVEVFGDQDCYSLYHLGACQEYAKNYPDALAYFRRAQLGLGDCQMTQEAIQRVEKLVAEQR